MEQLLSNNLPYEFQRGFCLNNTSFDYSLGKNMNKESESQKCGKDFFFYEGSESLGPSSKADGSGGLEYF